jgi:hypothetical protein
MPHQPRRNIAQIHRNESKSSTLQNQIRSPQTLFDVPATHPQKFPQFHASRFRRMWIKSIAAINQSASFLLRRSRAQSRKQ